ncbi:class I SAM-dependent methyltransferase [Sphingobium sp. AN558]|uniref:class I SAM-dependent methyltransferase n=1 Tax=Sphingobium sp. AN558 TaxID=3133442 RepID=UPI0030C1A0B3
MTASTDLLATFVARYPAQPATAFWRGIEIEQLARAFASDGVGLDLGCGDGILTDILFKRIGVTPRLIGVDIDPLETEAAAAYSFYDRIHTIPAQAIPEPDASIDYVISNSVLEHIPDLEGVIAEVGRLLKPGGRFYFTVPAPGFHRNLRGSILPGVSRERYLADLDKRLAHFHYLSAADWRAMSARHGLALDSATGYLDGKETRRWEHLSRMTGGLLHSLSFGKSRPIEIQRALRIRDLQNRMALPAPVASGIAKMIACPDAPDSDDIQSCLLVTGHRPRD